QFVAGLDDIIAAGGERPRIADDGHQHRVQWEGDGADAVGHERGCLMHGELQQTRPAAFETHQMHETADLDGLLDQGGHQARCRQVALKSDSFFGLVTRDTVRGTPNSVLASSESTRLVLSSPVAATTTSASSRPASARPANSQASESSHSAPGMRSWPSASLLWSMRRTE